MTDEHSTFSGHLTGDGGELGPGTVLGNYELQEPLGRGGMGQVWKAWDRDGKRAVAIKLLPPEFRGNEEAMEQVRESFQQVHGLTHQHIGKTLALLEDRIHGPFLVLEFVPGTSLARYAREYRRQHGPLSVEMVMQLLAPIARALDYSHARGVLHRDLKPQNILVETGSPPQAVLIDFGLAAAIRSTMTRHTQGKIDTRGTRPYMSPEQLRGKSRQWDGRTDQYSLAVVVYELLGGCLPFEADDDFTLMQAILNEPPDPLEGLSAEVNTHLLKGLSKERNDRFPSCVELIEGLDIQTRVLSVPSRDYPTITAAMQAARSGDSVLVQPGTYQECVELKDGVTLLGADRNQCLLQLKPGAEYALLADRLQSGRVFNLTIDGMGLPFEPAESSSNWPSQETAPAGVFLRAASVQVRNCLVRNFQGRGILVTGPESQVLLAENILEANGVGLRFTGGAAGSAESNVCRENQTSGIQVQGENTAPTLVNNVCENNQRSGISFSGGSPGTAERNHCRGNRRQGIVVIGANTAATLLGNVCEQNGEAGIVFSEGAAGRAEQNNCRENTLHGIAVKCESTTPALIGNLCEKNQKAGIYCFSGGTAAAERNTCRSNGAHGIHVQGENTRSNLVGNTCEKNTDTGIVFSDGATGTARENICCENTVNGIKASGENTAPTLINNICARNHYSGISFRDGAAGRAEQNLCRGNHFYGIHANGEHTALTLTGNTCEKNNDTGIVFSDKAAGQVEQNICRENTVHGIAAYRDGTTLNLVNNTCENNLKVGILFDQGAGGTARQNVCRGNESGIVAFGTNTAPLVIGNTCENNLFSGILITYGAAGTAEQNICRGNQKYGIQIYGASTAARLSGNRVELNAEEQVIYKGGAKPVE